MTFELYKPDRELTRAELIDELAAIPGRLRALVAGRGAAALSRQGADGGWSALDTCKHVRDIAQVYGMRFKWMILQDEPLLANYDEDRWVSAHPDRAADVEALLGEIAAYRAETVRLLSSLSPEAWTRTGRHEVLGRVELDPYVRHEYAHEEQHLAQLGAALGTGP